MAANTREELLKFIIATEGDEEIKALVKDLIKLGDSSEASAGKAKELLSKIEQLGRTGDNIQSFTRLKASLSEFGDKIATASKKVTELEGKLAQDTGNAGLTRQLERAKAAVSDLEKEQNRMSAELGRTSLALQKDGVDVGHLGVAYAALQEKLAAARGEVSAFGAKASTSNKELEASGKGISKLGSLAEGTAGALGSVATKLALVAAAATTAAVAVAGEFFKGALDSSIEFDSALSEVQAVTGATGATLDKLKKSIEESSSASRKFTAVEAAQGLTQLARATGNADSAMVALTPTLNLAQAAGISVADAATIMTATLTEFGLQGGQATSVADLLATAANKTNHDIAGLGTALGEAAPLAKQLGVSAKETVAVIGDLASKGFTAEKAGTALREVFTAMIDPTSQFSKALRGLGIDSNDFGTVLEQLATKGDKGRLAIETLSSKATPAILALVNNGGKGLQQFNAILDQSTGAAERTAAVMGEGLDGSLAKLKVTFDETRRALIEPILQPLADELTSLSGALSEFAESPDFAALKVELAGMFHEGALAAKELIQNTDFHSLATSIRSFVSDAKEDIADFRQNIGGIIFIVEKVGDTIRVVFNAAQEAVFAAATAIAFVIKTIAQSIDLLSAPQRKLLALFGVADDLGPKLQEVIGGLGAVTDDFAKRTLDNAGEAAGAFADLAGLAEENAGSVVGSAGKIDAANQAVATSAEAAAAASHDAAAGLVDQSTAATTAAVQMDEVAKANAESAAKIKNAFTDLGIQSQTALDDLAASAKRNFEIIREAANAGQASQADVKRGFDAYAQAARAAVKDSEAWKQVQVESQLALAQSALRANDSLTAAGAAGADAGDKIARGGERAASAWDGAAAGADHAADSERNLASASADVQDAIDHQKSSVDGLTISYGASTQAFADALQAQNFFANSPELFAQGVNRVFAQQQEQQKQLDQHIESLKKQNSQYDETGKRLDQLRKQYTFLGDAQLKALIDEQDKLAQNTKTREDAAKREKEQLASNQRAAAPAGPATPVGGATTAVGASNELIVTLRSERGTKGSGDLLTISDADIERIAALIMNKLQLGRSISVRRG